MCYKPILDGQEIDEPDSHRICYDEHKRRWFAGKYVACGKNDRKKNQQSCSECTGFGSDGWKGYEGPK